MTSVLMKNGGNVDTEIHAEKITEIMEEKDGHPQAKKRGLE